MILILPASKTQDFETPLKSKNHTQPAFLAEAAGLMAELRRLSPAKLAARMTLSDKLAAQVFDSCQHWHPPFTTANARPALWAYAGDLYDGLEAASLTAADLRFAQERLRILSGLYGLLRPLDLMQAYRLEMGARVDSGSLTAFWGERITEALNEDLDRGKAAGRSPVLLNLASEEYAKAVRIKDLRGTMITPLFQEGHDGSYKVVSFFAKRARGRMARFVVQRRLESPEALKGFQEEGYAFAPKASTLARWIFRREAS